MEMNDVCKNLELYYKVSDVPEEAQKKITGGRLNGMTNINPMWRIKMLTKEFGICGFGWKTEVVKVWKDEGANGVVVVNVEIKLYVKMNGEWSEGITGIGGSTLVAKETGGLFTDDECYKKALTDALSVACKSLGIGAGIYWSNDPTKYDSKPEGSKGKGKKEDKKEQAPKSSQNGQKQSKWQVINGMIKGTKYTLASLDNWQKKQFGVIKPINNLTDEEFELMKMVIENSLKEDNK